MPAVLWMAAQVEVWGSGSWTDLIHGPRPLFALAYSAAPVALCFRRTRPVTVLLAVVAIVLVAGAQHDDLDLSRDASLRTTSGDLHATYSRSGRDPTSKAAK